MNYNPEIHKRRSIRLKGYDYSRAGAYFLTICSWNRECLFGDIENGEMQLNEFGQVVEKEWQRTVDIRSNVELDFFVVMPNHMHGIIILNDDVGARRCLAREKERLQERAIHRIALTKTLTKTLTKAPTKDIPGARSGSIGAIIGQFKSIATKQINVIRNTLGFPVWQRNYYEHIIRSNDEMNRIQEYIINNPAKWAEDENNPENIKS